MFELLEISGPVGVSITCQWFVMESFDHEAERVQEMQDDHPTFEKWETNDPWTPNEAE